MSIFVKNYLLLFLLMFLISCSRDNNSKYGTNQNDFQNKRSPRDNEFIKNGGYKIKIPKNPFVTSEEAIEIYNKDQNNSLKDIPEVPKEIKKQ